ncbi:post-transcriptional regulator [Bacillus thermotolerans]|uniref:post-transcriptional regulator n=1 Tax=Bacillus thermotolerans TaxID=1221996 RepID=UPI00057E6FCD|nr:post-transcriptional regulator [Bacillus thermotolerans]KKB34556.1 hypothetical protein QY97_02284 [Bacillus thermotolerans]KKB39684.1 hypothetical protein QY96_02772 [Bacillus thermotolerans]
MAEAHPYQQYFQQLLPVLKSKVEEFRLLNYGTIDIPTLWEYLTKKKWKKPKEHIHIYELVSDIVATTPGDFMSYKTVEAFRGKHWFGENGQGEWQELLGTKKN